MEVLSRDEQLEINKFAKRCATDLIDYEKCLELKKQLETRVTFIKSELDINNEESSIKKIINEAELNINKLNGTIELADNVIKEVEKDLDDVDETRKCLEEKFEHFYANECTVQYMKIVLQIETLSKDLEKEFINKDDEKCATIFANICEISRNLMDSKADNLRSFLTETLIYWHNILKEKLVKDFDEILKAIKWPFVNANFSLITPSQTNVQKLQILSEYLLQIELPEESTTPILTSALLSDFPPLCLPIHYLVVPLRRRFIYHFYGGRQTNRVDKPEWYFTQILSWIRDHIDFVTKWIQPIIDKLGLHHIDAKLELMRGLVQLSVEKLNSELPNLQFDDFTFSHSVDEALGFDKELRETYKYPSTQPSVLAVLTQAQVFLKWISMERKYATEKMDAMLSSNTIDPFQTLSNEEDEFKITNCADSFVTLLQTIMERYESLPQPGHRLQFLDLQLDLLDEFRVRLLQLVKAQEGDIIESYIPMIANTVYYVENVLTDWGTMLHYLNLYYYKNKLSNLEEYLLPFDHDPSLQNEIESVFANTYSLYSRMRKELLSTLSESVIREVKLRSANYRRERWSKIMKLRDTELTTMKQKTKHAKSDILDITLSLTPSACPMFEVLARRLHQLQKHLAPKLFTIVWRFIAEQLDQYLFEELILENRFSEGGAYQVKFDVTRNLFPLFAQFSEKPENYFSQLKESCDLLNISKGSALLLRETLLALEGATGVEDRRGQALKEIGVVHFTPQMSIKILNRRADITVDRLVID